MKLRIEPLKVGKDESFEQDVLDRKDFGQSLLNLITKSEDELVISIDGQWGDGKSTFVQMWQGMLTGAEIPNRPLSKPSHPTQNYGYLQSS